jgi:hypothetical protein
MKLFKNPMTQSITIWQDNMKEQYQFYSKKEAIKKFKDKYKLRGKVTEVNYSIYPTFF